MADGLDLDALSGYLTPVNKAPGAGATGSAPAWQADLFDGGKSNLTYRITEGSHDWVLRRPPHGHVPATAHDMAREYHVMSALARTPVPVPAMVMLCEDTSVIGAPFYVMATSSASIADSSMSALPTAPESRSICVRTPYGHTACTRTPASP